MYNRSLLFSSQCMETEFNLKMLFKITQVRMFNLNIFSNLKINNSLNRIKTSQFSGNQFSHLTNSNNNSNNSNDLYKQTEKNWR